MSLASAALSTLSHECSCAGVSLLLWGVSLLLKGVSLLLWVYLCCCGVSLLLWGVSAAVGCRC